MRMANFIVHNLFVIQAKILQHGLNIHNPKEGFRVWTTNVENLKALACL